MKSEINTENSTYACMRARVHTHTHKDMHRAADDNNDDDDDNGDDTVVHDLISILLPLQVQIFLIRI